MRIVNHLKWTAVWTAIWSMTLAPVAMGEEAQKVSVAKMQEAVQAVGLDQKITLGEFYKKNKELFSPRVQKLIEPVVAKFKNEYMPQVNVMGANSTTGEQIPVVQFSKNNELINMQWYGEKEKMMKLQNVNISQIDTINFTDMFTRLLASDEKYQIQLGLVNPKKKAAKVVPNFKYPDVTKAEWNSMSAYDRANYIINLRLLWQDAKEVLKARDAGKSSKRSENIFQKNKHFYSLFFTQEIEAAESKVKTVVVDDKKEYAAGESCIVAGYVASYQGKVCSPKVIDAAYTNRDNSLYLKAKEFCAASSKMACNPYVFGAPNGEPTCVTPSLSNNDFQKASHWDGPCDTASRLNDTKLEILKDEKKQNGRYEDGNLLQAEKIRELAKTEQGRENYKLTEQYLLGVLKFRGKVKSDAKSLFENGVVNDEVLEQILLDKKAFDREIGEATQSCNKESQASKSSKRYHETNYWKACDQLNRRYLFVTELFASKCEPGSKFNEETLKCICPAASKPETKPVTPPGGQPDKKPVPPAAPPSGPADVAPVKPGDGAAGDKPEVCPGGKCATVPGAKPITSTKECEEKYSGLGGLDLNCKCSDGKDPVVAETSEATGQVAYQCGADKAPQVPKEKADQCTGWCMVLKVAKYAAIAVLVVIGVKAIVDWLAPKKPEKRAAPDVCPSTGQAAPCPQVCTPPLKNQSNGTCSCDGCPVGQTANAATCYCSSTVTTGLLTCPDGVTKVSDLTNCPTYACWNGQSYQNPMNCPTQPTSSPSRTTQ